MERDRARFNELEGVDIPEYVREHSSTLSFPEKLMYLMICIERETAKSLMIPPITWTTEGDKIIIRNEQELQNVWFPLFFKADCKFASFTRKMYRWGFKKVVLAYEEISSATATTAATKMPLLCFQNFHFRRDHKNRLYQMESITSTKKTKVKNSLLGLGQGHNSFNGLGTPCEGRFSTGMSPQDTPTCVRNSQVDSHALPAMMHPCMMEAVLRQQNSTAQNRGTAIPPSVQSAGEDIAGGHTQIGMESLQHKQMEFQGLQDNWFAIQMLLAFSLPQVPPVMNLPNATIKSTMENAPASAEMVSSPKGSSDKTTWKETPESAPPKGTKDNVIHPENNREFRGKPRKDAEHH